MPRNRNNSNNEPYWRLNVNRGDTIHVRTQHEHAVLEVVDTVGNQIIYNCLISDGVYYGTSRDDSMIHKSELNSENFEIEPAS